MTNYFADSFKPHLAKSTCTVETKSEGNGRIQIASLAPLALAVVFSCIIFYGCNKEAAPGSTKIYSSGSPYTILIAGNRNFHHQIETETNGVRETTTFPDTALLLTYVDNATISINRLTFELVSISDTTNLFLKNFTDPALQTETINFFYKHNLVVFENDKQPSDTTEIFETFQSFN